MNEIISRKKLLENIHKYSDKALVAIETKYQNRIAALQKCVPWPALIHSLAGDLEIVWAEQRRRHAADHRQKMEDAALYVEKLYKQQHDKR